MLQLEKLEELAIVLINVSAMIVLAKSYHS